MHVYLHTLNWGLLEIFHFIEKIPLETFHFLPPTFLIHTFCYIDSLYFVYSAFLKHKSCIIFILRSCPMFLNIYITYTHTHTPDFHFFQYLFVGYLVSLSNLCWILKGLQLLFWPNYFLLIIEQWSQQIVYATRSNDIFPCFLTGYCYIVVIATIWNVPVKDLAMKKWLLDIHNQFIFIFSKAPFNIKAAGIHPYYLW